MATQVHVVRGKAMWAKIFERNRDTESSHPMIQQELDKTDGKTSIEVILDEEGLATFEASGSKKKINQLEDGPAVRFERPFKHRIEDFGGAPRVVDGRGEEDKPWDENINIGNGSDVEVMFVTYDTSLGKGTRLEAVRVLDLVEYSESAPDLPF